jgi:hypothetical protein
MLARSAQICVEVRFKAMVSLETKAEVVPGVKWGGKVMADWDAILVRFLGGEYCLVVMGCGDLENEENVR